MPFIDPSLGAVVLISLVWLGYVARRSGSFSCWYAFPPCLVVVAYVNVVLFRVGITHICKSDLLDKKTNKKQLLIQWNDTVKIQHNVHLTTRASHHHIEDWYCFILICFLSTFGDFSFRESLKESKFAEFYISRRSKIHIWLVLYGIEFRPYL